MTQTKLKRSESEKAPKNQNVNGKQETELKSKYFSDKCIQIAAWVLLTLGLCIIVSTFYFAINQRASDADGRHEYNRDKDSNDKHSSNGGDMNVNIVSRIMDNRIYELGNASLHGCEEKICKMICIQANELFSMLFKTMQNSDCRSLDSLVIYNQYFEGAELVNSWQYGNDNNVQEVAIVNSNITIIRSDAFNSPMFSTTFLLYWHNLNLQKVESGALLGLHSLKYLMINSAISCLDRAFFQPIQTTLVYLKIHAGLTIAKGESVFGISNLKKLEYADLSRNNFNGPITNKTFASAPKLKYLILQRCKITSIKDDAFSHLAGALHLLDLSHNMLTTMSDKVLEPLFSASVSSFVNVAMNSFVCDCNITPLVKVYKKYRVRFMDALYCKAPHQFYGKFIDEVYVEQCGLLTTTQWTTIRDLTRDEELVPTTTFNPTESNNDVDDDGGSAVPSSQETTSEETHHFQMRCWNMYDSESNSRSIERTDSRALELSSDVSSVENDTKTVLGLIKTELNRHDFGVHSVASNTIDYFDFEKPDYEFELHLFENNSVRVTVDNPGTMLSIVWFDEYSESVGILAETTCFRYITPYLITEPLEDNTTYTFCLINDLVSTITPFNCLPLHVPVVIEPEENIWISRDQKQFTIGMLFLIFLMSTFTGAAIAYFGIKAYPDLLEGSKNVLVVKKSDQTCYVSTITEADYAQKSSLKKKSSLQKNSLPSSTSTIISAKDLECLSSVKSSSTYFEDAFLPINFGDDEYEMPKPTEKPQFIYDTRCIPNTYVATSPRSPPPLPKRNSKNFSTDSMIYGLEQ